MAPSVCWKLTRLKLLNEEGTCALGACLVCPCANARRAKYVHMSPAPLHMLYHVAQGALLCHTQTLQLRCLSAAWPVPACPLTRHHGV